MWPLTLLGNLHTDKHTYQMNVCVYVVSPRTRMLAHPQVMYACACMHLLCLLTYRQVQPGSHGRLQRLPRPVSAAIFHVFLIKDTLRRNNAKYKT
jgi:hypothetical protein